jgi:pyridinium-3,5-bisthiocarboxylic acid mononucleotide nickel chelatase
MKLAYLDCFSGISGDMVLGAWLDLGLPAPLLRRTLKELDLPPFRLRIRREERGGLSGFRVLVLEGKKAPAHCSYRDLRQRISESSLALEIKEPALEVLRHLAVVEGHIHGREIEEVHFHEIGALDTVIDAVGAALGFHFFQVQTVWASPLPVGLGWVQSQHGPLPLPAPATLALLKGTALVPSGVEQELITPTGAAIVKTWVRHFGPPPACNLTQVGYGLGHRELPDRPNALRIWLGEGAASGGQEQVVVLETNIDDMNPQWYDYLLERLLQSGALDCLLLPCQMKKNRPGVLLQVLCRPADRERLMGILLAETTTLGVRFYEAGRQSLARKSERLKTPWGPVGLKWIERLDPQKCPAPEFTIEYDDLKSLAAREHKSLKQMEALLRAYITRNKYACTP